MKRIILSKITSTAHEPTSETFLVNRFDCAAAPKLIFVTNSKQTIQMLNNIKKQLMFCVFFSFMFYSCSCKEGEIHKIDEKSIDIKFNLIKAERWEINGHTSVDGFIKNDSVAVKVGYVILTSIYGDDNINNQLPFNVSLYKDSIWIVTGTLPDNIVGGVAYIELRKSDGQVLRVAHGK